MEVQRLLAESLEDPALKAHSLTNAGFILEERLKELKRAFGDDAAEPSRLLADYPGDVRDALLLEASYLYEDGMIERFKAKKRLDRLGDGTDIERDQGAIRRLVAIQGIVGLIVLTVLGAAGYVLVRNSLRPLAEVERTARAIADGDLSQRVPEGDDRTEGRTPLAPEPAQDRVPDVAVGEPGSVVSKPSTLLPAESPTSRKSMPALSNTCAERSFVIALYWGSAMRFCISCGSFSRS